jgi:hypothetical protein
VVRTIHNTLLYFETNRQMLFETPPKVESVKVASKNGE